MRHFVAGIVTAIVSTGVVGVIIWIAVLPRLNWGAGQEPSRIETRLASNVLERWVRRNAGTEVNPLSPTPENLKAARTEYEEHCAACHGADGMGRNRFEAEFYPPVMKLTDQRVQILTDSEIYFVVARGVSNTAMPAFAKEHSPEDMWKTVLWVRHLAHLSADEKAAIEKEMQAGTAEHERIMERGMSPHTHKNDR